MKPYNLAMVIDFYEFTMAYGYFREQKHEDIVYFDLFFRNVPDNGGYAIFAGLDTIIDYIATLSFEQEDIAYLRDRGMFDESFLQYLLDFSFQGDIISVREGTVVFPNEPLLTVKGTLLEAQLIETYLLQVVNHQSLIATKASRIKRAASDRLVLEMGARRAHGATASIDGAKAAFIGGIDATSNVVVDQLYRIPALGTMAHSWVQSFDSEYDAFKAYAKVYPNQSTFLIDTYDTIESGLPNAIKVIKEVLLPRDARDYAIRLDSGSLLELSKQVRSILDNADLKDCKIVVSNSLDEYSIQDLLKQGAPIDLFGVGERLITAKSDPVFGAVYKLVAMEQNGTIVPKMKQSDTVEKQTVPGVKKIDRVFDEQGFIVEDVLFLHDESSNQEDVRKQIFRYGKLVYDRPSVQERRQYCLEQQSMLRENYLRLSNADTIQVKHSSALKGMMEDIVKQNTN